MHDLTLEGGAPAELRAAIRVSVASIVWTVGAGAIAIAEGLARQSLVLVAFGLIGAFDALASVALVVHFRHALRHESFSAAHERLALRLVFTGLCAVGVGTLSDSARRLATESGAESVPVGVAVAAASAVVLSILSTQKTRIARRLSSRALRADARLSATGAALAVITVGGTALVGAWGWWWADPVAAAVVACGAGVLAFAFARG